MALLRHFATVGGGTIVSRVLGFARDVLTASALGTGPVADAFFVAFRLPNLFRRIFAEGAFNAAFVPLFAKALEGEGARQARRFAEESLAALLFALLVLTALAEIAMPVFMLLLAPGFVEDPGKFGLSVLLTRITFPYLTFISLVALLSGVLNALGRFAAAAFAPALLNAVLIGALLTIHAVQADGSETAGVYLAIGVFIAGIAQLVMLGWAARRAGMGLTLVRPRLTPGVKRLVALGIPGVIAGGITQINIMVGTMIASLQDRAVSFLYYADRLYQLPLGTIGIAIGIVLLPELSRRLRAGDDEAVMNGQNRALEFALTLTLPSAAALFFVPDAIIRGLFERGAFGPEDTAATAAALAAFAVGLPAFVLNKVFAPAFFAREDTRTPMYYAGVNVAANIAFSLALFPAFGHVGIAAGTSIAGWINSGLLGYTLWRTGHLVPDARVKRRTLLALHATAWMSAALVATNWLLAPLAAHGSLGAVATLLILVGVGVVVFAGLAATTGVMTRADLARAFSKSATKPEAPSA
ncbi:murein biosynthesis integral membrane protein MurJ [Microbaculum sp. FT89]|uniref:murein biosynthesis integral membrane protein MurJ n=1 Tax=Microbaculum sp. FT89 TaxID=3447298 RepID=UPI003F52F72B